MYLSVTRACALRNVVACVLLILGATIAQAQDSGRVNPATALPAGFPVYKDTGNPKEDHKRYDEAKRKWIEENKEEYGRLVGRREEVEKNVAVEDVVLLKQPITPTSEQLVSLPTEESNLVVLSLSIDNTTQQPIITSPLEANPPKKKIETTVPDTMLVDNKSEPLPKIIVPIKEQWILTDIKCINNKRSAAELSGLVQKFTAEYFDFNALFIVHQDNSFCLQTRGAEIRGKISDNSSDAIILLIQNDFCEDCYKDILFKILKKETDLWIWQMASEWESAPDIVFEITFAIKY